MRLISGKQQKLTMFYSLNKNTPKKERFGDFFHSLWPDLGELAWTVRTEHVSSCSGCPAALGPFLSDLPSDFGRLELR